MRSEIEIQEELVKLKAMRDKIPATNWFGESNIEAIDAQIFVLSNSDINERGVEQFSKKSRITDYVFIAYDWMTGASNEIPSDDWIVLLPKEE